MNKVTINGKEVKLPEIVVMPVVGAGIMAMLGVMSGAIVGLVDDGTYVVKKLVNKVKK